MPSQISPLVVPARPASLSHTLGTLRDYAARVGHLAGLSQRAIYNLKLAVDEIATNIIHYGYHADGGDYTIAVTASVTREKLVVVLEDTGRRYDPREHGRPPGFDTPLDTREIGGLGIYLALTSVDEFEYEYVDGCNRNIFTMKRPVAVQTTAKPVSILLYEGDSGDPFQLMAKLTHIGYMVESHTDREQVYQWLLWNDYDVLLIDSSVEHHDVFWLLKHLMLTADIKDTPAMVISSNPAYLVHCLELGAKDYIHEPVDMRLLTLRIESIISNSPATLRGRISKLSQHIKHILLSDEPDLRFGPDMNFDRYLEKFLIEVLGIYNADAGTVYMRTDNDALRFDIMRTNSLGIALGGTTGREIDLPTLPLYDRDTGEPNHHHIASHVALTGRTINIADIYENDEFDFSGTRWFDARNHYRSITTLTVPLKDHTDYVIGVVQLINAQDESGNIIPFDSAQQMIVEALCAHTAVIMSNHQLLQKQDRLISIENDLKIGRRIQRDFMPQTIPQVPGWQIDARFYPAREVAGDFYDLFLINGGLVMVIVDVCDKGVGAALFMALIRSLLRAFISQARESILALPSQARTEALLISKLKQVVYSTNDYILTHHYDLNMFATLFIGVLAVDNGRLLYINGGHTPAPLVKRHAGGSIEMLHPTGPAVGMFEDAAFVVEVLRLKKGDLLMAFTDGIADVKNASDEPLGQQAIIDILQSDWDSMDELLARMEDRVSNHKGDAPQFDDMTFWVVQREE